MGRGEGRKSDLFVVKCWIMHRFERESHKAYDREHGRVTEGIRQGRDTI